MLVLCTVQSFQECSEIHDSLSAFSEQIKLIQVDENIWLKPFEEYNVKQKRPKLMHAYGTTQVFNPEYVSGYKRLIFMDLDTFLIATLMNCFAPRVLLQQRDSLSLYSTVGYSYIHHLSPITG